jgi:hypothetical protein
MSRILDWLLGLPPEPVTTRQPDAYQSPLPRLWTRQDGAWHRGCDEMTEERRRLCAIDWSGHGKTLLLLIDELNREWWTAYHYGDLRTDRLGPGDAEWSQAR